MGLVQNDCLYTRYRNTFKKDKGEEHKKLTDYIHPFAILLVKGKRLLQNSFEVEYNIEGPKKGTETRQA